MRWTLLAALMPMLGVLVGCGTLLPGASSSDSTIAEALHERTIREARAEVTALRAEVAATRIAMAKKEAELLDLRRQVEQLRAPLQQEAADRRPVSEALTIRAEAVDASESALVDTPGTASESQPEEEAPGLAQDVAELDALVRHLQLEIVQLKLSGPDLPNRPIGFRRVSPRFGQLLQSVR